MTTRVWLGFFGPKGGHGGRGLKHKMTFSTVEAAEAEARNWINEERRGAVDIRLETFRDDGILCSGKFLGQVRWEESRNIPVRYPYPDT